MSVPLAPLSLRKLGRGAATNWRHIARRRVALPFTWLDSDWQLRFVPLDAEKSRLLSLAIDWGGVPVMARVDEEWIVQIAQRVMGVDDLRQLPDTLRPLVIEAAFEGLAGLVESVTRKRFSLLETDAVHDGQGTGQHGVGFTLDDGNISSRGELWFDDIGLGYLARAIRHLPPVEAEEDWSRLPISIRFCVGRTILPLSSLRDLRPNDVILLDESWVGGELNQILVMAGRLGVLASISGRQAIILEEPGAIMEELDEDGLDEGMEAGSEPGFCDLPVRLHFDLGERQLTLSELMSIGPGYVFDLGREIRRAVIIRANGKPIGEGELVDIDGQIGVVILSLASPERD